MWVHSLFHFISTWIVNTMDIAVTLGVGATTSRNGLAVKTPRASQPDVGVHFDIIGQMRGSG